MEIDSEDFLPISPVTLKFYDVEAELGFVASRKECLCRRGKTICRVGLCLDTALLFICMGVARWHERKTFESDVAYDVHLTSLYFAGSIVPLLLPCLAIASCRALRDVMSAVVIEVALACSLTAGVVCAALSAPIVVCNMKGASSQVVGYASDSGVLLTVVGVVAAAHAGLPVRWLVMLPLELVSVATYAAIVFGIGSPEPTFSTLFNLFFLAGIVASCAAGKRITEHDERRAFLDRDMSCRGGGAGQQVYHAGARPVQELPSSPTPTGRKSNGPFGSPSTGKSATDRIAHAVEANSQDFHWYIDKQDVKLLPGQVLGRGSFGIVLKGVWGGIVVAVKLPNKELDSGTSPEALSELCDELRVFRHLRHPNIATLHGAIVDPALRRVSLVVELVRGMVLCSFICRGGQGGSVRGPSTLERYQVLLGVCSALLHLHTREPCIVHSNLSSSNIMVEDHNGEACPKLLDFGMSRILTRGSRSGGGTFSWMAPEARVGATPAGCSADMYSFGHLITFVATDISPPRLARKARRTLTVPPSMPWPLGCPFEPGCKWLADACCVLDENERPTIDEAHRQLLRLPGSMGLEDAGSGFLQEVRCVAAAVAQEADGAAAAPDMPALREMSWQPTPEEPEPEEAWKPVPHQPCTSRQALQSTLLATIARWNFRKQRRPCCELHAAAEAAQEICSDFLEWSCMAEPLTRSDCVCSRCGICILEASAPECDHCGAPCAQQTPPAPPAGPASMAL